VPPEFHQSAIDEVNAIFKTLDDDAPAEDVGTSSSQLSSGPKLNTVNPKWRTLRDFVDEKGILDASEAMDEDRLLIDDLLATRADNPAVLEQQISEMREAFPALEGVDVTGLMDQRDVGIHEMATRVESLAAHYDQLEDALRAFEAGEQLHNDDLEGMHCLSSSGNQAPRTLMLTL
jgi:autophagy-related protein 17